MSCWGILLLAVFAVSSAHGYNYTTKWFTTKVDHFGYANNDTYQMRYLVADQYWDGKPGRPIFFYTGNEGSIVDFATNTGLMWDWAPEFHAHLIFAEHRYYGESMPYGKKSYDSPKYLGYLTVSQALADFADLLTTLKKQNPLIADSPVVSFGGSYGGMLAAWFRMKYPHVTKAALAASAPILQFQNMTGCNVYNDIVTKAFTRESPKCSDNIRKSWSALDRIANQSGGVDFIRNTFKICQKLDRNNYTAARDWLYETYGNMGMVNYPYPTTFLKPVPGHNVREACKFAANPASQSDKDILVAIYKTVSVFHNYTGKVECNDLGQADGAISGSGWNFQSCTEMVMPMCGDGTTDMFYPYPWDFAAFRKGCEKQFGVTPDLYKAELLFGGMKITDLSNIIFSNGEIDPWSGGGVRQTLTDSLPAIIIKDAAHHYDLRPANDLDTPEIIAARKLEKAYIKAWLGIP